jgi:hypothetical protein
MPLVDLVGGDLPLPIGGGGAVGVPYTDVDVLIDRVPFWLAISADVPYQRETAQFQREQVDQQPEAGEQSLAGWWTRSQMSFHFGAGLDYLDTTARPQPEDRLRYKTSRNVDVWTPGRVTRLPATTVNHPVTGGEPVWMEPTQAGLIIARPSTVEVWNGTAWTTRNYGSSFQVKAFCTDGVNYYVATLDGVWRAPISGTATATKVYDLPGDNVPMCLGWVKQRLMLGHGAKVYSLDAAGPALPTPKMTHPVASWTWSSFADAPSGIVACGYAGLSSAIYKFELSTIDDAPILGPGVALLSMPLGEQTLAMLGYLGSMLVIGTSRGVRVCPFDTFYGTISLGPLSVETEAPVAALGGYDRFIWAGTTVRGETSLVRLDLSAPLDETGHYAWAPDLVFPTGTWTEQVTSIAFLASGRKAIGVTGRGVVLEGTATDPSDSAWLETARIRMGTVESKHFSYATVRGIYGEDAPIGVSISAPVDPQQWETKYVATTGGERFGLRVIAQEWIALRFDFSEGSELASYQVQALPAGKRQRLIALPVWVTDYQRTRSGVEVGYPGWARERLDAVERLESGGTEITVSAPALFPESVIGVIEKLTYAQTTDPGDVGEGSVGVLQLVLRTTA